MPDQFGKTMRVNIRFDLPQASSVKTSVVKEVIDAICSRADQTCYCCGKPVGSKGACADHADLELWGTRSTSDLVRKAMKARVKAPVSTALSVSGEDVENAQTDDLATWRDAADCANDVISKLARNSRLHHDDKKTAALVEAINGVTSALFGQLRYQKVTRDDFLDTFDTRFKKVVDLLEPSSIGKVDAMAERDDELPDIQGFRRLYKPSNMHEFINSIGQRRDHRQAINPCLAKMSEFNSQRKVATVPEDWEYKLNRLGMYFPNFKEVTDLVRKHFALAMVGDRQAALPAILLDGPPGVGKTFYAKALADLISTTYLEIHMESAQNSADIAGSSSFWANTSPGKVFEALACHDSINPVILVDELDKAKSAESGYDPLAGLYSLLEPNTAKRFTDACFQMPIDASHIIWIATSNEANRVPAPIRSRMAMFKIKKPTFEETLSITQQIYTGLLEGNVWGSAFEKELSEGVRERVAALEPRLIRTTLFNALGSAALQRRNALELTDIVPVFTGDRYVGFY